MHCLKCQKPVKPKETCYGMHEICFGSWFQVSPRARFTDLARMSSTLDTGIDITPKNSSFFQGTFKKYSAVLEDRSFILKMRQPMDAPELPEVEYLCNQIAALLTIPVAKFYIIYFEDDLVFVTENFIQNNIPMDLHHFACFRKSTEHNCKDLIAMIGQYSKQPHDIQTFVKTTLFDALVGNHDRHGRNLGFVATPHQMVLSPIYDNVSYLGLESGKMLKADFNPKGKISTQNSEEPTMQDYVLEFKKLGFLEDVLCFYTMIKMEAIKNLVEQSFCSEAMKEALQKLILKRYRELKDALKT